MNKYIFFTLVTFMVVAAFLTVGTREAHTTEVSARVACAHAADSLPSGVDSPGHINPYQQIIAQVATSSCMVAFNACVGKTGLATATHRERNQLASGNGTPGHINPYQQQIVRQLVLNNTSVMKACTP